MTDMLMVIEKKMKYLIREPESIKNKHNQSLHVKNKITN